MRPTPQDAFHSALARYGEELRAFVRDRLPVGDDVDDVLQDIWAGFSQTLDRMPVDQPRAWLYRTARNRLTDSYRRGNGRKGLLPLQPEELTPAVQPTTSGGAALEQDELWAEIEQALALLPANQREVFARNEIEGQTLREIAEDLGEPLKTIISRKGYARRRLQELLRETYDDYFM